jgi:putative hydroxymethylpyrimidine transport system permease protein
VLAVLMAGYAPCARALRPVLLISQVIPIFALAPILTLWLGFGMAPKIVVTALICFFPVAAAFFDGLTRTTPACRDLARTMGANGWREMWHIRIPMALPMLGSGLRLAAVYAPVGAVIGEWVGGSDGLGAVMIHANGRMRTDLSFATIAVVTLIALAFHAQISALTRRLFARFE